MSVRSLSDLAQSVSCDRVTTAVRGPADADHAVVVLADDGDALASRLLSENADERRIELLIVYSPDCWWTAAPQEGWGEADSALGWLLALAETIGRPLGLAGYGRGGQGALFASLEHSGRFPAVAAVAPASDLSRWYDRDLTLQAVFASPDQARQHEAPLRLNPLQRPRSFWIACDPRDQPCTPSSLRIVTKLTASGVPVEHDLVTECGTNRLEFTYMRSSEWLAALAESLDRVGVDLPIY